MPKIERKQMTTLSVEQSAKLLQALDRSVVYSPTLRSRIQSPLWDFSQGFGSTICATVTQLSQAEALLTLGIRQSAETLVCCREDGKPKQPRSLTHEFAHPIATMGFQPRVRFHDLRHGDATQMLTSGIHPKIAQERLGHSTITTTMDLYSHVTETIQVGAADRLDAAFQPAITKRVQ